MRTTTTTRREFGFFPVAPVPTEYARAIFPRDRRSNFSWVSMPHIRRLFRLTIPWLYAAPEFDHRRVCPLPSLSSTMGSPACTSPPASRPASYRGTRARMRTTISLPFCCTRMPLTNLVFGGTDPDLKAATIGRYYYLTAWGSPPVQRFERRRILIVGLTKARQAAMYSHQRPRSSAFHSRRREIASRSGTPVPIDDDVEG
jgi:hypothetical protein